MPVKLPPKMLIVLIAIVVVSFLVLAPLVSIVMGAVGPPDFSIDTEKFSKYGISGEGNSMWDGELIDSIRYVTGTLGEKVVIFGKLVWDGALAACVPEWKYELYFTQVIGSWGGIERTWTGRFADAIGNEHRAEPVIYSDLPSGSGWVRVKFYAHVKDWCLFDKGWVLYAQDDAYVKFGGGWVDLVNDQYEVGETAVAEYGVGYARSAKKDDPGSSAGWTLTIYSGAQGRTVLAKTLPGPDPGSNIDIVEGQVAYEVVPADFKVFDSCAVAEGVNYLEVRIYNNLVLTKADDSTVVDVVEKAPPQPSLSLDKAEYVIGDSARIEWSASPNSETQLPICGVHLKVTFSRLPEPLVDTDIKQASGFYSIAALPDDGIYTIEVWSFDAGGRTSIPVRALVKAVDPTCVECDGEEEPPSGVQWWVWLIIGALLMAAVGFFFAGHSIAPEWQVRAVVAIAILLVAFSIWFVLIILPMLVVWWQGVMNWWGCLFDPFC